MISDRNQKHKFSPAFIHNNVSVISQVLWIVFWEGIGNSPFRLSHWRGMSVSD